jgi:Fic family protein
LQIVRSTGNWEAWVEFFMTAVLETARQALTTIQAISALVNGHRRKIETLGKAASSALQIHHAMIRKPFITVQQAAEKTNLSFPSVNGAMKHLEDLGIAREITGKTRNRLNTYAEYLDLLKDGTEPIPQ